MTGQRRITLVSSDDQSFELAEEAAVLSKLVENTLDDDEDEDESAPEPIHLPRVSSACLTQVVSFLNHHVEEPMTEIPIPLGGRTFAEVVRQAWYQEFVENMQKEMRFEVLAAANYMEIKPLLDLSCLQVTFELSGRSADEIREILNLPQMTAEEEARAREEHRWIFEDN